MSKKRSLKESGLSIDDKASKKRKTSHKSGDNNHYSKHSKKDNKSSSKTESKHKKSKRKKHKKNDIDHENDIKSETQYIDHPQWKYLRISTNDYYKYHTEFGDWALKKHKKFLDEMSTKKCKKLFVKFIEKWNDGKLEEKYYETFSSLSINNQEKTRYKWSFEKKIDSKQQMQFDLVRDTVDNQTNCIQISNEIAQIFQRKFAKNHEKHLRQKNKKNRNDIEFERDGDGMDSNNKKVKKQEENMKQKRYDRKQRIKEKKEKEYLERQEKEKIMLASYQSFVSSGIKKRKK